MRKIPVNWRNRIIRKITGLSKDPHAKNNNTKRLKGSSYYRLRVGDYRIFYDINNEEIIIYILEIKSRGKAYK